MFRQGFVYFTIGHAGVAFGLTYLIEWRPAVMLTLGMACILTGVVKALETVISQSARRAGLAAAVVAPHFDDRGQRRTFERV